VPVAHAVAPQVPVVKQVAAQQTPPKHCPEAHWSAAVHVPPGICWATHWPELLQ